jgi:hypothetical protein
MAFAMRFVMRAFRGETTPDLRAVNVIAYGKTTYGNSVRLEFVMRIGMLCALCARITKLRGVLCRFLLGHAKSCPLRKKAEGTGFAQ